MNRAKTRSRDTSAAALAATSTLMSFSDTDRRSYVLELEFSPDA